MWYMFLGLPDSNHDFNVVNWLLLNIDMFIEADANTSFELNKQVYLRYYLLVDGTYLSWSCFVQSIHQPRNKN